MAIQKNLFTRLALSFAIVVVPEIALGLPSEILVPAYFYPAGPGLSDWQEVDLHGSECDADGHCGS